MEAQYYLWALGIYGLSALGCIIVWYRMTRGISIRAVKVFLRGSAWIALCTIWPVAEESISLSPAFFTMLFDGLTHGVDEMMRTGRILAGLWVLLVVLILFDLIFNRSPEKTPEDDSQAASV